MVTTSIQVSKPQGNVKSSKPVKTVTGQVSLFNGQLPENIRLRMDALEQLERDFWLLLDCQTDKRKQKQHRLSMQNFDRDFASAQRLGLKPSDIIASIIGAMFEDNALMGLYYEKNVRKGKSKKGRK